METDVPLQDETTASPGPNEMPSRAEIGRERTDRLYVDGYDVVANGSVHIAEGSVVAFKPFPKSKNSFTVELCFETQTSKVKPDIARKADEVKRVYRWTFSNWPNVIAGPHQFTDYRGRRVMGFFECHPIVVSEPDPRQPRMWSLCYTFFLAPKLPRKH